MFYYYIKIAFKNLWNNKKYSAINVLGFAVSLAIFLAIILFVLHEKSYDQYHVNSKNIYRLLDTEENSSDIDYRVKDILNDKFSEVTNACYYAKLSGEESVTYDENGYFVNGIASVDNAYFEIFDFEFIKGNKTKPFENINSAVLTERCAQKLFGNENPIGKELMLMGAYPLFVTAVIKDFPDNSSFNEEMIINAENDEFKFSFSCENYDDESTHRWPFHIYIEMTKDGLPESLTETLNSNIESLDPYIKKAGLLPLHDIYLNDPTWGDSTKKGNPGLIRLLLAIAAVILILAIINYINLTLAQQQKRGKEIGIRKTIGASKKDLVYQFIFECIIVISIAFSLSILIFELCYPLVKNLFGSSISILSLLQFPFNIFVLGSILCIGIITGLYPALSFASFNPINIFGKGLILKGPKKQSRNFLTIFQFAVSITLIFCALVIWKQIEYSKHKDLGFNKDQLLKITLPPIMDHTISNRSISFINDLRNHTHITDLTSSRGVPGEIRLHMGSGVEGKDQSLAIIYADSSFLKTFNINIIKGRNFLSSDDGISCMFNETAMKYLEWETLDNKKYTNGRKDGYELIAVVEDFHTNSIHHAIEPTAIIYKSAELDHASLKIKGDKIGETMAFIQEAWQDRLSEFPMSYMFYDDWFNNMYEKEERFGRIISYFTILGIIISCIGIFGLAIFNAERKSKEIGIRKVNGASVHSILKLLTKEYALWVFIAFVIASPIAYFLMRNWLQDFAYKTELSWWIFMVSGVSALTIASLSIVWHSLKAALGNPVDALRYE